MSSSAPATSPRPLSEKVNEPVISSEEVQHSIIEGYLAGNGRIVIDESRLPG